MFCDQAVTGAHTPQWHGVISFLNPTRRTDIPFLTQQRRTTKWEGLSFLLKTLLLRWGTSNQRGTKIKTQNLASIPPFATMNQVLSPVYVTLHSYCLSPHPHQLSGSPIWPLSFWSYHLLSIPDSIAGTMYLMPQSGSLLTSLWWYSIVFRIIIKHLSLAARALYDFKSCWMF